MKLGSEDLFQWRSLQVIVVKDEDPVSEYEEYFASNDPTVVGFSKACVVKRSADA